MKKFNESTISWIILSIFWFVLFVLLKLLSNTYIIEELIYLLSPVLILIWIVIFIELLLIRTLKNSDNNLAIYFIKKSIILVFLLIIYLISVFYINWSYDYVFMHLFINILLLFQLEYHLKYGRFITIFFIECFVYFILLFLFLLVLAKI